MGGQLAMIYEVVFMPHHILVLSYYECNKYLSTLTKSVTKSTQYTRHMLYYTKVPYNFYFYAKKCLTLPLMYAIIVVGGT